MTMLDTMRRHKGWLKWSLFLVVLTFIAFYIPTGNDSTQAGLAAPGAEVARVGSRSITVADFQRVYNAGFVTTMTLYAAGIAWIFGHQAPWPSQSVVLAMSVVAALPCVIASVVVHRRAR